MYLSYYLRYIKIVCHIKHVQNNFLFTTAAAVTATQISKVKKKEHKIKV